MRDRDPRDQGRLEEEVRKASIGRWIYPITMLIFLCLNTCLGQLSPFKAPKKYDRGTLVEEGAHQQCKVYMHKSVYKNNTATPYHIYVVGAAICLFL